MGLRHVSKNFIPQHLKAKQKHYDWTFLHTFGNKLKQTRAIIKSMNVGD